MRGKVLAIVFASLLLGIPYVLFGGTFDFNGLDSNPDGKIDLNELNSFIQNEILEGFSLLDKDGDGFVDKEELQAIFGKFFDFNTIDANKDRKITQEELATFIFNLLSAKFVLCDLNFDGSIDAEEFKLVQAPSPWLWVFPDEDLLREGREHQQRCEDHGSQRVGGEGIKPPSAGGMMSKEYLVDEKKIREDFSSNVKAESCGLRTILAPRLCPDMTWGYITALGFKSCCGIGCDYWCNNCKGGCRRPHDGTGGTDYCELDRFICIAACTLIPFKHCVAHCHDYYSSCLWNNAVPE